VAVKVALKEFNGIVTLAGTVRAGTLEFKPTTCAPFVAAALRLTVQVVVPPDGRELAAHPKEVRAAGAATRMLPPFAATGMASPATDAARAPLTPMEIELALGVRAIVTTATPPSGMVLVLSPAARQIYELALPAQVMLLPEDVSAESGATEKLLMLAEG
jgi:hypothetical protein